MGERQVRRDVLAIAPAGRERMRLAKPKEVAAGLAAVTKSFRYGMAEAGLLRTWKTMRTVNRFDGYDCPGCAWPDPDGHRSGFEFCENGAKAFANEATKKRVTPELFGRMSVEEMSRMDDMWLDKQGRLTHPMVLESDSSHYRMISWEAAFEMVADAIRALDDPDEAVLYTSGRTSNEAAFLWGTLARQIGTNNLPDCSNMCHESSGYALSRVIGIGKGTVKLEDFAKSDMIVVIGQNPGSNHPRMLTALADAKQAGASVVSINPLVETGMGRFKHPQQPLSMLGRGTRIADEHLQVRVSGDAHLLKGLCKVVLSTGSIDREFIEEHTEGFEDFAAAIESVTWEDIVSGSGVEREDIERVGEAFASSERMIICWAMGLTQHRNSVAVIQEIANLLFLGGHFGRPGAGACPVRGHSNVQGDRTVGIVHHPKPSFIAALNEATGITAPEQGGLDTVEAVKAMRAGKVRLLMAMGGNLLSAMSDTVAVAEGISQVDLTVQISTKLNRSHLVTGNRALILPCMGRTEIDEQESGPQFVSVENSMGVVHSSRGSLAPASAHLRSEVSIVCGMGHATFGDSPFAWQEHTRDYAGIRSLIEAVVPGFDDYEVRVSQDGGFHLPNGPRDGPVFPTDNGKAKFTVHALPQPVAAAGQFTMMTVRSHDQYNTTIYGNDDRYRGVYGARRIVLMNRDDMATLHLSAGDEVDITSHFEGKERHAARWKVVPAEIPEGNVCTYFPEANVLIPLESVAEGSNTPTSKSVAVSISGPN